MPSIQDCIKDGVIVKLPELAPELFPPFNFPATMRCLDALNGTAANG